MQSAASMLNANNVASRHAFTTAKPSQRRGRQTRSVVRASKDDQATQGPSELVMRTIGAVTAAQLALLPLSGAALAEAKGKLAVQGATDAGQAAQNAVPEGAKNPKTREERNRQRDQGIGAKLNTIKDRVITDNIMSNPDVEKGGNQNIFFPGADQKPVAFEARSAPALQVNVSEQVQQKASEAAKDAGSAVKNAAKQVKTSAPVFDHSSLQVSVNEEVSKKVAGAAKDAANTVKNAPKQVKTSAPAFDRSSLQVSVNEEVSKKVAGAAKDAANTVKNAPKQVKTSAPVFARSSLQLNTANPIDQEAQLRFVGNPVSEVDLGRKEPNADPFAPAGNELPSPGEAVDKAKDAAQDAAGGGLLDKIKDKAVSGNSPQRQLEKAGDKVKDLKKQPNVSFTPAAMRGLQVNVGLGDNASFQSPERNEGGITQPNRRSEGLVGDPKRGGDLKDAPTDFASQFKGDNDSGTPGQTGAEPRNPSGRKGLFPGAAGGAGLVRDDSETPEKTAAGNIAKAQQSNSSPLDGIKNAFGQGN